MRLSRASYRKRYESEDRCPPSGDAEAWAKLSLPVYKFLKKPRSWDDMLSWRIENGVTEAILRNSIAWLDRNGRIVGTEIVPGKYVFSQRVARRVRGKRL